ncbi:MAG: (Fe-S)-binding protein [Gammaproteobacteria bacterium]|nr:(Fe-S)-binding protein [Gammaproteobacteria bacterium]MCY4226292.1 (Fe-S)-binding protein [Gammaproteobacteria bacterium]
MNGSSSTRKSEQVALLVTCLSDLFRPQIAHAAVELIEKFGYRVDVPKQTCCGQPAYNAGEEGKTRILAESMISLFEPYRYVIAPSGSCAATIKEHYPGLFHEGSSRHGQCMRLVEKTHELSGFLVDVVKADLEQKKSSFDDGPLRIAYHDSCSGLRELGIRSQPRKLLKDRLGIDISEMSNSEVCCGFGGMFCVKYPEISTSMVDSKIDGIEDAEAEVLLGGDLGCLMNIAGRLRRLGSKTRVYHYAEFLTDSGPGPAIGYRK